MTIQQTETIQNSGTGSSATSSPMFHPRNARPTPNISKNASRNCRKRSPPRRPAVMASST